MGTYRNESDRTATDIGPEMLDLAQNSHRIATALEELVKRSQTVFSNPAVRPEFEEPNSITYAMLLGVCKGFAFSLREILDDPALNSFQRAQKLRKQVTIAESMAKDYQDKLDELKRQQGMETKSVE